MRFLALLLLLTACDSVTHLPGPPQENEPCGAICGGTGQVTVLVSNPTSYPIKIWWWWYNVRGDSGLVAANSSGTCFRFTPSVWAQFQVAYGTQTNGGNYTTDAFDPVAAPRWQLVAMPQASPSSPPYGQFGFAVSHPTTGC